MKTFSRVTVIAAVGVFALFAAAAFAQQEAQAPLSPGVSNVSMRPGANADEAIQNGYGLTDASLSTVSWSEFIPYTSSATFASNTTTGTKWNTAGSSFLYAPLPSDVPNGALLTQIVFYVVDSNATYDFTGRLCAYYTDSGNGANPGSTCPFSVSTTGSVGDTVAFADPALTIQRRFDVDGDGTVEVVNWLLHYNEVLATDGSIAIHQARIYWKRQVSPAPATASFADVPTTSPFFKYVEALYASGLIAGCGGGNYCPTTTVNRGQMAVFLAGALGMHWPE